MSDKKKPKNKAKTQETEICPEVSYPKITESDLPLRIQFSDYKNFRINNPGKFVMVNGELEYQLEDESEKSIDTNSYLG